MSAPSLDPDGPDPDSPEFVYDEMSLFGENRAEYDLPDDGSPVVERIEHRLDDGRALRALRWGTGPVELVLLHGGAQNAHTWDTVVLAMGQPATLAIDLPGHGHSDPRPDGRYDARSNAEAVASAVAALAPDARVVVGMSLGGLTANALAAAHPGLVRRLVVVDVTPGVDRDKAKDVIDFIAGPQSFSSFGEIFARTVEYNPTRSASSLRRGILHNAHRMPDGTWEWNYDRRQLEGVELPKSAELWEDVSATTCPYLLLRGSLSPVVDDADVAELRRRRPDARVEVVDGAGHSIQGDQPIELARLLGAEIVAG
jgi:pimeloyl-ACP methyl ester carboxylesterase